MSEQHVLVDLDVPVPMRDGVTLRANIYRPAEAEGRWPVLLTRLPYGKDLPLGGAAMDAVQTARRGYVVVIQDTRGRFASEGEWRPFENEANDGVDTIAWAADLPYADGQVGMIGASYFGFTQWAAAIEQPPALKAMAPRITWADPLNGFGFRGGALELGTPAHWGLQMGFDQYARHFRGDLPKLGAAFWSLAQELDQLSPAGYASLPLNEFAPLRRHPVLARFFEQVQQPMNRELLDAVTITGKYDRVRVPTLNVGGWYDVFLGGTIANYLGMRAAGVPTKLLIGPWTHTDYAQPVGELNFGFGSQAGLINLQYNLDGLQLRWFDHWLKGIDTGMMAEPPIKLFVMGANVWRDEQEWPLARAVQTPFYFHASGRLSTEPPQQEAANRYTYDPSDPVPTHGGAVLMAPEYANGPRDQRAIESRPDVLIYTSDVLDRDVEVTGPVSVSLWACSSAPDTDFVARLVDVYPDPDGRAYNLTDGIIRARYRSGVSQKLLQPGVPERFDIDLWATSNVFRAGHRMRVQITSSNFPRWDRNPNTGHAFGTDTASDLRMAEQTILHDADHPSCILLYVVPTG